MYKKLIYCVTLFLFSYNYALALDSDQFMQKYSTSRLDIIPMNNDQHIKDNNTANTNDANSTQNSQASQPLNKKSIWQRMQIPTQTNNVNSNNDAQIAPKQQEAPQKRNIYK